MNHKFGFYLLFLIVAGSVLCTPVLAYERLEELPIPTTRSLQASEEPKFNQAVKFLVNGNLSAAQENLTPLAKTGVLDAQLALSSLLSRSDGVDAQKASLRWTYLAANGGHWSSQVTVSNAYRDGSLIPADYAKARSWLKKAAQTGEGEIIEREFQTLNNTVLTKIDDSLKQRDYTAAEDMLIPLAQDNLPDAQEKLAFLYKQGFVGEDKKRQATEWFKKAADAGSQTAQYELGMEYLSHKDIPEELQQQAVKFLESAAQPGKPEAQYQLGMLYLTGKFVGKDEGRGIFMYKLAAEQGHPIAQYSLGVRYVLGEGIDKDDNQAHRWFRSSAEQGFAKAMHNLALTYLYGIGTERQPDAADRWFRAAANDGVKKSAIFLNKPEPELAMPQLVKASIESPEPLEKHSKTKKPNVKIKKSKSKKAKANTPGIEMVKGADWFLNLPQTGFTLQVLSAHKRKSVNSFFKQNGLAKKNYLHYIDNSPNKPMHVVQYGYYDSRADAKKAANKISGNNKKFKPWVRDVKTIRNKIANPR